MTSTDPVIEKLLICSNIVVFLLIGSIYIKGITNTGSHAVDCEREATMKENRESYSRKWPYRGSRERGCVSHKFHCVFYLSNTYLQRNDPFSRFNQPNCSAVTVIRNAKGPTKTD